MKRNWKRILSLWLTVCMVFTMNFGLGATSVYAAALNGSDDLENAAHWSIAVIDTSELADVDLDNTNELKYLGSTNAAGAYTLTAQSDATTLKFVDSESGKTVTYYISMDSVTNAVELQGTDAAGVDVQKSGDTESVYEFEDKVYAGVAQDMDLGLANEGGVTVSEGGAKFKFASDKLPVINGKAELWEEGSDPSKIAEFDYNAGDNPTSTKEITLGDGQKLDFSKTYSLVFKPDRSLFAADGDAETGRIFNGTSYVSYNATAKKLYAIKEKYVLATGLEVAGEKINDANWTMKDGADKDITTKEATQTDGAAAGTHNIEFKSGVTGEYTFTALDDGVGISVNALDGADVKVNVVAKNVDGNTAYVTSGNNITLASGADTYLAKVADGVYLAEYENSEPKQAITATAEKGSDFIKYTFDDELKVPATAKLASGNGVEPEDIPLEAGEDSVTFNELVAATGYDLTLDMNNSGLEAPCNGVIGSDGKIYTGIDLTTSTTTTSANAVSDIEAKVGDDGQITITNSSNYAIDYAISTNNTWKDADPSTKTGSVAKDAEETVSETKKDDEEHTYYLFYKYNDSGVESEWSMYPDPLVVDKIKTISANWSTSKDISNLILTYGDDAKIREELKDAGVAQVVETKKADEVATASVYAMKLDDYEAVAGDEDAKLAKLTAAEHLVNNMAFEAAEYVAIVSTNYADDAAVARGFNVVRNSVSKNFTVQPKKITLKLFADENATSTDVSISTNDTLDTSDFVLKAYNAAGEEEKLNFASFKIVSSNGAVYANDATLSFPDKETDYTFHVSANGVKSGEVMLDGGVSLSTNYTVAKDSNDVTVHVYKIGAKDRLRLVAKDKPFYYFNNKDVKNLNLSDYFTVERVTGDAVGTVIKDTQNLKWAIVSSNGSKDNLIRGEFEKAFKKDNNSVSAQLIALKEANASSVSAGQVLYVAVSSDSLKISSIDDTSEAITIQKQPIVIAASETIQGLQGVGLDSYYKDGKYKDAIKVLLVDENGKVGDEDYADRYTTQIASDYKLATWTTSNNATIVIGSEIDDTVYGNQKVALDTTLKPEIAQNFVLYEDQKYTDYYITPSLLVSFTDLDGTSISDNAIYWNPYSYEPLKILSFNSVDGSADRNTQNATWYVKKTERADNGEYYQYLEDITINVSPINSKGEKAAPYTGAQFGLEDFSSPVEIFVKFGKEEAAGTVIATDKKNSNFGIKYIKPVFYTGEKLVASDDTKLKSKKGYNGVLDVVVEYNGKALIYGDDYSLSYKNNVNAAESSAKKAPTVQVTGKGSYKGMKASATFNILKADFSKIADVTMKKTYVKYTGKDFSKAVKATAVFSSGSNKGKKLSSKAYTIKVYEVKDDDVKTVAGSYAKNDTNVRTFEVVAISTGKDGNYAAGSKTDALTIYGIPSSAKKLSIKGVTKKVKYDSSGVNLASFVDVKTATAKVGKKTYALSEDKVLDVTLTDANNNDFTTKKTTDTGKFVVSVGPKVTKANPCGTLSGDHVYEPTTIKVTHQGKKFGKSNIKLETSSFAYSQAGPTLNFVTGEGIDASKVKLYVPSSNAGIKNNFAYGSTSVVTWKQLDGTLAKYTSGLKASTIQSSDDFTAPGTHRIWVESTGEYTGGFYLSYSIKPIKYSKKDENIVVKLNGKTDIQTLKYNPAGHDASLVSVYYSDGKTEMSPVNSNGKLNYTLSWKDAKVADEGGTLTVKGTGTIFTGSISVKYNVAKSSINKSAIVNYDEVTTHDSEHVYYKLASKLRGSSTIPTKLVQVATNKNKNGKDVVTEYELKAKKDYVVTMDTESATATKGSATFDASAAKGYENSVTLQYSLYPNEIKSVDITLSNNGKVSMNEANVVETINGVQYYGIDVTKVVITYKDSSVKSETLTGTDIANTFKIKYSDNNIATTKAKVTLSFNPKLGNRYPTGTSYYKYFTITEK